MTSSTILSKNQQLNAVGLARPYLWNTHQLLKRNFFKDANTPLSTSLKLVVLPPPTPSKAKIKMVMRTYLPLSHKFQG